MLKVALAVLVLSAPIAHAKDKDTFQLRRMLWLNAQTHEGHGEVTCFPKQCAILARKFDLVFDPKTGDVKDAR